MALALLDTANGGSGCLFSENPESGDGHPRARRNLQYDGSE